uniref:Uncharacterized protein n=1 Tax=Oryza sativa subsp. japonica TaxID=39947 RepID=Q6ZLL6_ORYSJ|nr:hypothetical protein [Oryza sativa Japonica Group]
MARSSRRNTHVGRAEGGRGGRVHELKRRRTGRLPRSQEDDDDDDSPPAATAAFSPPPAGVLLATLLVVRVAKIGIGLSMNWNKNGGGLRG